MTITYLSLLHFLKFTLLILFLLVNLVLLYYEYLDRKHSPDYLIIGGIPSEIKKIASNFFIAISALSAGITIKEEYHKIKKVAETSNQEIDKNVNNNNKLIAENFRHKLNLANIVNSNEECKKLELEKSELQKTLNEKTVKFNSGDKKITKNFVELEEITSLLAKKDEEIAGANVKLRGEIEIGKKSSLEISKLDNSEVEKTINEKKSSIFNLDELLTNFESLNGISKLAFTTLFSSSVIL